MISRPDSDDSGELEEALLLAMLAQHVDAPAEVVERWRRELADALGREASGVSR